MAFLSGLAMIQGACAEINERRVSAELRRARGIFD